jgi:orotidine 5'-phosphate decarboxylase subfamily 1
MVVLKTHMDCLEDFSYVQIKQLKALAKKHHFYIFEDRKFADIGQTAQRQFTGGIHRIADWADLINAHGLCGSTQIEALKKCVNPAEQGLLLIANMSQENSLFTPDYSKRVIELGLKHIDYVCGFIAPNLRVPSSFLNFSPGVHLDISGDQLGQQYKHPAQLAEFGVDSIIVGRGILKASDPVEAARRYCVTTSGTGA